MISIILPTLGNRPRELSRLLRSLEEQLYNDFELIIVSQDNHKIVENLLGKVSFNYRHIKIDIKGLSNARNIGLKYVNGNLITFSDDDCWYSKESFSFVENYFLYNNVDVVCFQIFDPFQNEYYKKYSTEFKENISKFEILKKSSIEMFINLSNVLKDKIFFNTDFGLGSKYNSGEENIMLMNLKKEGYKITYYPRIIVYHKKTRYMKNIDSTTCKGKGALFKTLFTPILGFILLILFLLKKINKIDNPIRSIYLAIKEFIHYESI